MENEAKSSYGRQNQGFYSKTRLSRFNPHNYKERLSKPGFKHPSCFFGGCGRSRYIYIYIIHPAKLTWHWNIPMFKRKYIFKWWMFHCHVSFRVGNIDLMRHMKYTIPDMHYFHLIPWCSSWTLLVPSCAVGHKQNKEGGSGWLVLICRSKTLPWKHDRKTTCNITKFCGAICIRMLSHRLQWLITSTA